MKDIQFGNDTRAELYSGVKTLADVVRVTMRPWGRNVLIQQGENSATITKDGVSVAREVFLDDPVKNMGA